MSKNSTCAGAVFNSIYINDVIVLTYEDFKTTNFVRLTVFSFTLASCDNPVVPSTEECINHYNSNSDGKNDNCGTEMPTEKQDFKGLTFKTKHLLMMAKNTLST